MRGVTKGKTWLAIYGLRRGRKGASKGNTKGRAQGNLVPEEAASRFNPFDQTGELTERFLAGKLRAQENRCTVPIGNDRSPIAPGSPKVQCNRSFNRGVFGFESVLGFHRFKGERGQRFRQEGIPSRIPVSTDYSTGGSIARPSLRKRIARATGARPPDGPHHPIVRGDRVSLGSPFRMRL